jgi:RimJ/RimL family protein N-acetyltransferase
VFHHEKSLRNHAPEVLWEEGAYVFYVRMPRKMKDGDITLRPLTILDGPFMCEGLKRACNSGAEKTGSLFNASSFFFWYWMKKTFLLRYCIECNDRPIGFLGLYNVTPGESAEVALYLLDEKMKRRGYGTRVFGIFSRWLKRQGFVKNLVVRIRKENDASAAFWTGLGFVCRDPPNPGNGIEELYKNL